jgi:hypothetical protein
LAVLAVLAVGLAGFYYFTGEASTLPLRVVPHLEAQPLTLDSVAVGARFLPVQVSGFVVSLTVCFWDYWLWCWWAGWRW